MSTYFIIPARKNSKGFRHKNRFLFENLPTELVDQNVIITSDDQVIEQMNQQLYNFDFLHRPAELAEDTTSIKPVLEHVVQSYKLKPDDELVVLYLTYPDRTFNDIKDIISFYRKHKGKSLLCKEPLDQHPYLCFYDNGLKGKRIIDHNMYRRQDYPNCFFGSHYVSIVNVGFLSMVDLNLHNESETLFYDLGTHMVDVDYEKDLMI